MEGCTTLGGVFEERRQREGRIDYSKERGQFQVEIKPEPEVQES